MKKYIDGIDRFEKSVNEIGKLGNIVDNFNLTIKDVSEALMVVGDNEQIKTLNDSCEKAFKHLNQLEKTFVKINECYSEAVNLSLYNDKLIGKIEDLNDEVYELRRNIKSIKSQHEKEMKSLKSDLIDAIENSIVSLKNDNKQIINKVEEIINNTVIKTETNSFDNNHYKELAKRYIEHKEYNQALECYNKVINFKIENNQTCEKEDYLNRANILEILGKNEEAIKDYKIALNL